MVNRQHAAWPPPCEMPDCKKPGDGGKPIEVDFGTAGKRTLLRVCKPHRARIDAR